MDMKAHYIEKFDTAFEAIKTASGTKNLQTYLRSNGKTEDWLSDGFSKNTDEFKLFMMDYAKQFVVGRLTGVVYAAAVAVVADYFGVEREVFMGYAVYQFDSHYEKFKKDWQELIQKGGNPVCNHIWLRVGGTDYEYQNGVVAELEHLYEERIK